MFGHDRPRARLLTKRGITCSPQHRMVARKMTLGFARRLKSSSGCAGLVEKDEFVRAIKQKFGIKDDL